MLGIDENYSNRNTRIHHSPNIHKDTVSKILRSGTSPSETSQTICSFHCEDVQCEGCSNYPDDNQFHHLVEHQHCFRPP